MLNRRTAYRWAVLAILALGLCLRSAGLMRGLDRGIVFHPDVAKQVKAVEHYLIGEKVWYVDSLFYDGYPYGLNVIDSLLIRALYIPWRPIAAFLNPADADLAFPLRPDLYYWILILRVFYGTLTLALTILLARRLTGSRFAAAVIGLIAALAPLSATVAHFGTGDIGVDLFTVGLLVALTWCRTATPSPPGGERRGEGQLPALALALALAGLCGGLAFACKYQGALGLAVVGLYLLLTTRPTRQSIAQLALRGATAALSAILGAFMATPALHVDAETGWRNIRRNFLFLKDYGVPEEFLALPALVRARTSLSENIPLVLDAIGWTLVAAYFIGLAWCLRNWWQSRRAALAASAITPSPLGGEGRGEGQRPALLLAIAIFPLFALLVSTALKPAVQPFHFSYVVPPVCVVAGLGLLALLSARPIAANAVAALLALAIATELTVRARHECYFWLREDIQIAAEAIRTNTFTTPAALDKHGFIHTNAVFKRLRVESSEIPVFRNRPLAIAHAHAPFWRAVHLLPGPTLSLGDDSGWIFANGPVFPRDDRTFVVHPQHPVTRHIVLQDPVPETITLGIRAGRLPAEFRITGTGESGLRRHQWFGNVAPNAQTCVPWKVQHGKRIPPAPDGTGGGLILPLDFAAAPGPAWITVLTDPRELANFKLTGGELTAPALTNLNPALASWPTDTIAHVADSLQFLASPDLNLALTPRVLSLMGDNKEIALPGGRYTLHATVAASNNATLLLKLSDISGWLGNTAPSNAYALTPGTHDLTFTFEKPFAPFEVHVLAAAELGTTLRSWSLRPDTVAMLADLQPVDTRAPTAPAWMQPAPPLAPAPETPVGNVFFGRSLELLAHTVPAAAAPGEQLAFNFRFRIRRPEALPIRELGIFVHLRDASGKPAALLDFPLAAAAFDEGRLFPVRRTLPAELKPGPHTMRIGVYNPSLRKRLPARSTHADIHVASGHAVTLGTLEVRPTPE